VLVRGLDITGPGQLADLAGQLGIELMVEREGFAARTELGHGVYSASQWPSSEAMCMHHEMSYARVVPGILLFACAHAPAQGGSTGIADASAVLADLPGELVARVERDGWQVTRAYRSSIGLSWHQAFGTDRPDDVAAYAEREGIVVEWDGDELRTRQRRPGIVTHPVTGARCWFNQLAFLNEQTLDAEVRDYLTAEFGPAGLPFNTHYGDGSPVAVETVDRINEVYDRHTRREPWQTDDLLLVDNIRTAHSREPYRGDREVLVALGEPTDSDQLEG
jgi:alpha-ketoglutarate-dependent taurine dioxygenase